MTSLLPPGAGSPPPLGPTSATIPTAARRTPIVRIDALRHGDHATLLEIFAGLSPTSRGLRYHTGTPRLTPAMLEHLSAVAPGRHLAFVASIDARPVGLIRWIRTPGDRIADLSVEVVDAWQGHGVGSALAHTAATTAHLAGVRVFGMDVAAGHETLSHHLRRWGAVPDGHTWGLLMSVDLLRRRTAWPRRRARSTGEGGTRVLPHTG